MEIQVALDRIPLDRAVQLTNAIAPHTDWIEVGTSLIKHYGVTGLREVVEAAEGTPVMADLKTIDDAEFELTLAYDNGASSVTVLGLAPGVTHDAAVRVSGERGRELVVDLMGLSPEQIAFVVDRAPQRVVLCPHLSKDSQGSATRASELLGQWARGRKVALAGGITAKDLPSLSTFPDLRVIVGSAVTGAADPISAVRTLRRAALAGVEDDS